MIYQYKPQRGGRSIPVNENNPPQDPPPPPKTITSPKIVKPIKEKPKIQKQTPKKESKKTIPKKKSIPSKKVEVPVKLSWWQKIVSFLRKLSGRI